MGHHPKFREKRSLAHAALLLQKTDAWIPEEISLLLTCDVELGRDGRAVTVKEKLKPLTRFISNHGNSTYFVDAKLLENDSSWDFGNVEIGSHGYEHIPVGSNWWVLHDKKSLPFSSTIPKSYEIIKEATGKAPISFRAPKFSISDEALMAASKAGFKIDSSLAPYNNTLHPFKVHDMYEVPISRMKKPTLRFAPIPHLRYDSLMMGLLNEYGPVKLVSIATTILSWWKNQRHPMLCFICHPWELNKDSLKNLELFVSLLSEKITVYFRSMEEYVNLLDT